MDKLLRECNDFNYDRSLCNEMNEIFSIENVSSSFNTTATSKILFTKLYRMCIYKYIYENIWNFQLKTKY